MKFFILIISLLFFLQQNSFSQKSTSKTIHKYKLIIYGADGEPLVGIRVKFIINSDIYEKNRTLLEGEEITDKDGIFSVQAEVPISWDYTGTGLDKYYKELGIPQYSSILVYQIADSTDYPVMSSLKNCYGGLSQYSTNYYDSKDEWYILTTNQEQAKEIILSKKVDFLKSNFYLSKNAKKYSSAILDLIDEIIKNKTTPNLHLDFYSVGFEELKKQTLLSFSFISDNIYNSSRIKNIQIINDILDENVFEFIKKNNEYIHFDKNNIGLIINILLKIDDFTNDNDKVQTHAIKYLFYNKYLKMYLNKDISRQEFIKNSLILYDEDKIDIQ